MFQRLADRLRNGELDLRLLLPLLASTVLVQMVTATIRVTTSYRAVELNLSIVWLGLIAGTFAIAPMLMAVQIGRFIDRGYDAQIAWMGAGFFTLACTCFALWSSPTGLLISSTVLGVGHLMLMASQQMLCLRAGSPRTLEAVFGNYMVAGAIGQGIGPYVVGFLGGSAALPPTQILFATGAALAAASLAVVLTIRPRRDQPASKAGSEIVPIGQLIRVPGLLAVVLTGVIIVSCSDVVVIYVPLIGAERHIDVHDIGLLLTVRAAASMLARALYARLVAIFNRWTLMTVHAFAFALAYAAIALPLPLWAMFVAIAVMGFGFGVATTLSITLVVDMTTVGARGTVNSLRIMSNRIGQFAMPFGAGLIAAATGLTGLFLLLAIAIAGVAGTMVWKKPKA
jgi:MFS family permease